MRNLPHGECPTCGGDWDEGSRDMPAYSTCTCEPTDEPDEAYARANDIYRALTGSEL